LSHRSLSSVTVRNLFKNPDEMQVKDGRMTTGQQFTVKCTGGRGQF
jgi:hypothetical protein